MQYNQPYGVSDPNAGYINGNPSTGTMGSIPPAASIEYPQREVVNLIADSGLIPSNSDLNQLAKAVQSGKLIYADDTGTVNQLAVTLAPNVGNVFTKGFVIVTKANTTNTGPSTISVNGAGNWSIVHSSDSGPLNSFDMYAGQMLALAFDGINFQLVWSSRQPGSPVYLTGPRDYYVDGALGDDNYDGTLAAFTSGIHGPFKTIQKAFNQIPLFNLNGWSINIHIADHTYEPASCPRINGSGQLYMTGNHANPGNVVVNGINSSALLFYDIGGTIYIDGVKVQASGAQAGDAICGLIALGNTTVILDSFEFGPCVGCQITSQRGAMVSNFVPGSNWRISGGCPGNMYVPGCFFFAYVQGNVVSNSGGGPNITITQAITYNYTFIAATQSSFASLVYSALNNPGFVTGKRFDASYNSSIVTGSGANPSYYPGTIAGTAETGGYYT